MLNSVISSFWYSLPNYFQGTDCGIESREEVEGRELHIFFHILILCPPVEQNLAPNTVVLLFSSRMSRQACGNGRKRWCVMTAETHWEIHRLESKGIPFFKEDFKWNIKIMAFENNVLQIWVYNKKCGTTVLFYKFHTCLISSCLWAHQALHSYECL